MSNRSSLIALYVCCRSGLGTRRSLRGWVNSWMRWRQTCPVWIQSQRETCRVSCSPMRFVSSHPWERYWLPLSSFEYRPPLIVLAVFCILWLCMVMTEINSALSSCLVSQFKYLKIKFQIKLNCVRGVHFSEVYAQEKSGIIKNNSSLK